ncbi:MAG: alginate lyase family protein [Vicinamibacterales bacterium]
MLKQLERIGRMTGSELRFRLRGAAYDACDRVRVAVSAPAWRRSALAPRLGRAPSTAPIVRLLRDGQWLAAHHAMANHILDGPSRFPIHPAHRGDTVLAITGAWPEAPARARALAEPLLKGQHALLGYPSLDFGWPPDWHLDAVRQRRSRREFWRDVPYLDHREPDHKVIWELNRHQHWLVLGRAWWLTGDARYRDAALVELSHWMSSNPPLQGINWASMLELSVRSLSWTWALHFFVDDREDERPWLVDLILGLDRQLEHVERHLSHYFSPNTHLIGEALALFVCGHVLPQLAASARRVQTGRSILIEAIDRQIEPDGGHCERSTHYHRYTLDFYILALLVARLTDDPARDRFGDAVARLAEAARLLADDEGRLPHIGDDDGGVLFPVCGRAADHIDASLATAAGLTGRHGLLISRPAEEVYWLLTAPSLRPCLASVERRPPSLAPRSGALASTGYFVSRSRGRAHAVIDAGPHGFLNGGHSHADALSLTLTVADRPLLVDTGTGTYTADAAMRNRFRATAAHNTVVVDDRPQSDPAGPFHWHRIARAQPLHWYSNPYFDYFEGMHDGYAPVIHQRHLLMLHGQLLIVADCLDGPGHHRVDVLWHIHPAWQATLEGAHVSLRTSDVRIPLASTLQPPTIFFSDDRSGLGWYSPMYGRVEPLTTLRYTAEMTGPFWCCSVFGLDPADPVHAIRPLPFTSTVGSHGAAFRIERAGGFDDVVFGGASHRAGWQAGDVGGDGRVVTCHRVKGDAERVALVDAARVTVAGPHPLELRAPQPVPGLHLGLEGTQVLAGRGARGHSGGWAAGTRSQVTLTIGSHSVALADDRRTHVRAARAEVG